MDVQGLRGPGAGGKETLLRTPRGRQQLATAVQSFPLLRHPGPPTQAALHPPCRRVLRAAVLAAEEDGQEVHEELMQLYSACLLGAPAVAAASRCDAGGSEGGSQPTAPPQPGWCYKLFAYAPASEAGADTMACLAGLERRAAQLRCSAREDAERQPPQGEGAEQLQREEEGAAQPGLPAAAALGNGRHGLLALHVSLNLLEGGTGCHEWEAGFFLAEWVLSHAGLVAGGRAVL